MGSLHLSIVDIAPVFSLSLAFCLSFPRSWALPGQDAEQTVTVGQRPTSVFLCCCLLAPRLMTNHLGWVRLAFERSSELLKAKLEDRPVIEYDEAYWRSMVSSSAASSPNTSQKNAPVVWVSDDTASGCMVCSRQFTLLNRRHHCRRCGKVCCKECAPANNCRPIMEWGMKDPVRHCKACYKSPAVDWKE